MGLIKVERVIEASAGKLYALAKNAEKFPEVVPDLREVKIVESEGARTVTTWRATVSIAGVISREIAWKEEDVWDDDSLTCRFTLIEGDMKKYDGSWTFLEHPEDAGKTIVKLEVDFELGVPMLGALVNKLVDKLMSDNCAALLEGLERLAGE